MTDMQGRLVGKRLDAKYFLSDVLKHGTEGCNYLLAVDVDMNTVPGYAMSSWEKGYSPFTDSTFMPAPVIPNLMARSNGSIREPPRIE